MSNSLSELSVMVGIDTDNFTNVPVYHYTSANNMEKILFNKKNNIVFFASRSDVLNDKNEGKIALDVFLEVCNKLHKKRLIDNKLFTLLSNVKYPKKMLFINESYNNTYKAQMSEYETYIISFSSEPDYLPIWQIYCKNGVSAGVSIGFNLDTLTDNLKSDGIMHKVCNVIYDHKSQFEIINDFILKFAENDFNYTDEEEKIMEVFSQQLLHWKLFFKDANFDYEKEVRLILFVRKDEKTKVEYRMINNITIPYSVFELDKDSLQSITFGPLSFLYSDFNMQKNILKERLASEGYQNYIPICNSNIPLRYI